ncbi:MAG TPA: TonB-dependent receptor plug domain-containing protein, partial [Thermoanaerobaculia bacterium]|nr:TonB-dependent receptor plug domain-containing protein [Thermoanaerobaculia bacterium]
MRDRMSWRALLWPLAVVLIIFLRAAPAAAQSTAAQPAPPAPVAPRAAGAIAGTVTTLEGEPVTDAEVQLVELRRRAEVGADGSFRFDALPPGPYLLEATSPRLGTAVQRVVVPSGGTAQAPLTLDLTVHQDEILVTASPDARSRNEVAQPTSVLSGEELQRQLQPTLGETLNEQPGVTSTSFGMGASRPVIRGLGGDRIRVLESGLGSGDASTTSPDHAVSVDPLSAERIEVLRGPATLLYGSSAVGGVVNVIDNRIPDALPEEAVAGTVEVRGGSVADERGGAAALQGGFGRFAWSASFHTRETDDYDIPGFAESEALRRAEEEEGEEHEQATGRLPNSATDSEGGSLGASWIGDGGFLGVSVTGFDSLYGIPGGHEHHHEEGEEHEEEEEGEEPGVRVDLTQRRYDLRGGVTRPFAFFRGANVRFGVSDYEHQELEGEEVGTLFTSDSREGRVELLQRQVGPLTGS